MATTPFYYAGHPTSVVAAVPASEGVQLSITKFESGGTSQLSCVLDLEEFRTLLADGAAVLTDAEIARHCDDPDRD